jgi:hypothetical protein
VQTEAGAARRVSSVTAVRVFLEAAQDVDLVAGLPLAQQLVERLDVAGLERRESVQLEGLAERVDHDQLGGALAR